MTSFRVTLGVLVAFIALVSLTPSSALQTAQTGQGPALASIGPLAFGPDGTLFAADNQGAAGFRARSRRAGQRRRGGREGPRRRRRKARGAARHRRARNRHHRSRRASAHAQRLRLGDARPGRGRRAGAVPRRRRGQDRQRVAAVAEVPEGRAAERAGRQRDGAAESATQVITDMAFADGRLWVAGLSNEEFASKLRAIPYPFATVDGGTSVEIYHGNHRAVETRSPVNAFVPYTLNNQQHLIAGYTCTPLVKFPIADLKPGEKVRGTTIAEFGAGNRVLDMIVYRKGGQEFLLTANNSRGVMKIPTKHVRHRHADHRAGGDRNRRRAVREGREHDGHRAARQARRPELDRDRAHGRRRDQPAGRSASVDDASGVLRVAAVASSLVIAAACGRSAGSVSDPAITLTTPAGRRRRVRRGRRACRDEALDALRDAELTAEQWSARPSRRGGRRRAGMLGTYSVAGGALRFTPLFPLDPGRQYRVRFDPARLPGAGGSSGPPSSPRVGLPAQHTTPSTVVARVYPTGDVVPENLLRMYIEFSAPMGRPSGIEYMKLLDDSGKEIPGRSCRSTTSSGAPTTRASRCSSIRAA